jgi:hypothetical protein
LKSDTVWNKKCSQLDKKGSAVKTGFNIKTALHAILLMAPIGFGICPADAADDRLPPATSKPLPGAIDLRQFGAAGLVKAFDLARQLAGEVCSVLPADKKTAVYESAATQGILAARLVQDAIERFGDDLGKQNKLMQQVLDSRAPQGSTAGTLALSALTAVPSTLRAAADLTSLFKTDVGAEGIAYGEGARSLFVTALARQCPDKVGGLGSGYLGELDEKPYAGLLAKVRSLAAQRGELANRVALVQRLADAAKGDDKKELAAMAGAGGALLKSADGFIDSLRAGEAGERSPLFNAARYLAYAARTRDMLVLDFDLRLEGMTIVKDNLFTGQHLRLAGVAFLWYRLHEPNGNVRLADALRRMTVPVEVDLRGEAAGGTFWNGEDQVRR